MLGTSMRKAVPLALALLALSPLSRAAETGQPSGRVTEEIVAPAQPDNSVDQALTREVQAARGETVRARRELDALKKEYDAWKALNSRTMELKTSNDRLVAEHEALKTELQVLKNENEKASSKKNLYWFFSGAAVFVFGLLFGMALGGSRRRSGQSGYRF